MADKNLDFFGSQTTQSEVKAEIVAKYFGAWARIIDSRHSSDEYAYLDFFAGPGRYDDGNASTPLRVLSRVIDHPGMRWHAQLWFSDEKAEHVEKLEAEARQLPGFERIVHAPTFVATPYDDSAKHVVRSVASAMPTLLFVDPFGYKVLDREMIDYVLSCAGSEVLFFLNYNRVNAAMNNSVLQATLSRLFGDEVSEFGASLSGAPAPVREARVIEELIRTIEADGARAGGRRFVRPFRFWDDNGTRVTHHLIHATSHPLGHGIMKEIMAKHSTDLGGGVPGYEFNRPAGDRGQFTIFSGLSIADLAGALARDFAGRTVRVNDLYQSHHPGTPFIERNYKSALKRLEAQGKLVVTHTNPNRKPTQMPDEALVAFKG